MSRIYFQGASCESVGVPDLLLLCESVGVPDLLLVSLIYSLLIYCSDLLPVLLLQNLGPPRGPSRPAAISASLRTPDSAHQRQRNCGARWK